MHVRMGGRFVYGKGGRHSLSSPVPQSHQPSFKPRPNDHRRPPLSNAVTTMYGIWHVPTRSKVGRFPIYCLQRPCLGQIGWRAQ